MGRWGLKSENGAKPRGWGSLPPWPVPMRALLHRRRRYAHPAAATPSSTQTYTGQRTLTERSRTPLFQPYLPARPCRETDFEPRSSFQRRVSSHDTQHHAKPGRLRQQPEDGLAFSQNLPIQHQSGLGQSKSKTCYLKLESKIRSIMGFQSKWPSGLLQASSNDAISWLSTNYGTVGKPLANTICSIFCPRSNVQQAIAILLLFPPQWD